MKMPTTSDRCARGFTLIEILIALVIFSIGLLGLAGMQLRGSEGTNMAYFRSQATLLAQDMAERMHANRPAVNFDNAYAAMNSDGICAGAAPVPFCASRDGVTGASCTPAEMARFDLYTLACSAEQLLPAANISVDCNDAIDTDADPCTNGSPHTVTVTWNEINEGRAEPRDVTLTVVVMP